jgi:hypothetical protein
MLLHTRAQALQRPDGLTKKFQSYSLLKTDNVVFMNNILDKGFAEVVPKDELQRCDGKVRYIPHHGVCHTKKRDKIRVVFDCSSKGY